MLSSLLSFLIEHEFVWLCLGFGFDSVSRGILKRKEAEDLDQVVSMVVEESSKDDRERRKGSASHYSGEVAAVMEEGTEDAIVQVNSKLCIWNFKSA